MIEAVIFDWGGTISTHASAIRIQELWRTAARHLASHASHSSHDESALAAQLAAVEDAFWARTTTHQRAGALHGLVSEALELLDLELHPEVVREAGDHYLAAWEPHIEHDPEAAETLTALRERGIRTALLSNTHWPREYHERFLDRDGLTELFDVRLFTCELEYMKPHRQAFRDALDAVGVRDPGRALFVGDRPFDDIYGAQQAGMRTALRPNPAVPSHEVTPDVVLGALPELLTHVDAWRAEAWGAEGRDGDSDGGGADDGQ